MTKSIVSTEICSSAKRVGEEKAIELIAIAGFDAWDFSMMSNVVNFDWDTRESSFLNHPLNGSGCLRFARKLKKISDDNGIFCNQSHAPFPIFDSKIKDYIKKSLELTAVVGGKICVIHPDTNKSLAENAEIFSELLPFAKLMGIKIATENMWDWDFDNNIAKKTICSTHNDFSSLLKMVNDDYLVACVDIGHAEMRGLDTSAVQMIESLKSKVCALHIHDNDKFKDLHGLPFTNKINFNEVIIALNKVGYSGAFTLECDAWLIAQPDLEIGLKTMESRVREMANYFDNIKAR